MANLISFINAFASYFIVFVVFVAVMIIAGIMGVKVRNNQDAKKALSSEAGAEATEK